MSKRFGWEDGKAREMIEQLFRSHSDNRKSKIEDRKLVGVVALAAAFAMFGTVVEAQQAKKVPRIGFLGSGTLGQFVAFRQGLRDLGYIEGKNITIDHPKPEGNFSRAPARAAELVRLKVDVIVTSGATDTRAAKEATTTIPIVFLQDPDPVQMGWSPVWRDLEAISPGYLRWARTYLENGWSCLKKFCPNCRVWRCLGILPMPAMEFS